MQSPGTYISAVGHVGLIGWLILGWGFDSEPLVLDDILVSVISGEEFEQMQADSTPEPGNAAPDAPVQPVIDETSPPPPLEQDPPEPAPPPEPVEPPESEAPPPPPPPAPPETEVTDAPPVEPAPPVAPPPTPDVEVSENPTPPQADRIASTPSAPPPPDARVDEVVVEEVLPDDTAEPEVERREQRPTAPPEAQPEIAIADEEPTTAVETSLRPVARPARPTLPVPAEEPEEEDTQTANAETPAEPVVESDVQSVEDVLAGLGLEETDSNSQTPTDAPALPLGSQLSRIEIGNVTSAIGRKWVIDPGARSSQVVVTVQFSLTPDGRIDGDVKLVQATDAPQAVQDAAFRSARSALWAVSRGGGFPFPADKYEQWKDVVADFDPSGVRLR